MGGSGTGGMTKRIMKEDSEIFDDLVNVTNTKIFICLDKITYEMVSGEMTKDILSKLKNIEPFKVWYGKKIPVYEVSHHGE